MAKKRSQNEIRQEIIAKLDILAEYEAMGVVFGDDQPRASGKISCYSRARGPGDDRKPSAYVDTLTGHYGDSTAGEEESLSLFDFAVKYGGKHDFKAAWDFFCTRAGIDIKNRRQSSETPDDVLVFEEWTAGNELLARYWGDVHKRHVSVEAIKLAGGMICRYPCRVNKQTGQRDQGRHKCIALPCYGDQLTTADPVAWVLFDITGTPFMKYKKGEEPQPYKMHSCGPTSGTLMNRHTVERFAIGSRNEELVWKPAGPSDMLALLTAILRDAPHLIEKHLVTTNASGEAGTVARWNTLILAGRNVMICHDQDKTGNLGVTGWLDATAAQVATNKQVVLPFPMKDKGGDDLRDFLNGKEAMQP